MLIGFIGLALTMGLLIFSFIFQIAAKLRLTVPLLYFMAIAVFFPDWGDAHPQLAFGILYALIAVSLASWIVPRIVERVRGY